MTKADAATEADRLAQHIRDLERKLSDVQQGGENPSLVQAHVLRELLHHSRATLQSVRKAA